MKKIAIFLIAIMVFSIGFLSGCNEQTNIFINPPKPEVVSQNMRTGYEGLDYVAYIDVTVFNNGGSGKVTVFASIKQGSGSWTKNQAIYMQEDEMRDLTFSFKEYSFWDLSQASYRVWVTT